MYKVFIDGAHGTTGLRINEYLAERSDIKVLEIDPEKRKDADARVSMIKRADVSILCLPDQASREIAAAAPADSVIIDTSTAHRTDPDWVYGVPELTAGQRERIRNSARIANPGCHASGFILLVRPLIEAGILDREALLTCFCVTGYSGGGKSMIADYKSDERDVSLDSPGQYALAQTHKHLPEMVAMTGLSTAPCFSPVVADFYSGMVMTVPLHASMLKSGSGMADVKNALHNRYDGEKLIRVCDEIPESGKVYSNTMAGSNGMEMYVTGNEERMLLIASYDNLGKGASGAAVQNLNIVLGTEETAGLL